MSSACAPQIQGHVFLCFMVGEKWGSCSSEWVPVVEPHCFSGEVKLDGIGKLLCNYPELRPTFDRAL